MKYRGEELDDDVVKNLLKNEYGLDVEAKVKKLDIEYTSKDGDTIPADKDYSFRADVINTNRSDNYIYGNVRWEEDPNNDEDLSGVTLHVYANGETIVTTFSMMKGDYHENPLVWPFAVEIDPELYDPDAEYTVMEEFLDDQPHWFAEIKGLDVYNRRFTQDYVEMRVKAEFDVPYGGNVTANLKRAAGDPDGIPPYDSTVTLTPANGYKANAANIEKNNVRSAAEYIFTPQQINGYSAFIQNPVSAIDNDGKAYYEFSN